MIHASFRTMKIKNAGQMRGICAEHDRTSEMRDEAIKGEHFKASQIDWERTQENVVLERKYAYGAWENSAWEYEEHLLRDKDIKRVRKNAVLAHDTIYFASPEWFEGKSRADIIEKFQKDLEWHKRHFGEVLDATIHFDEKTPHMHIISVPLYENEKGQIKLSASHYLDGPKDLEKLQQSYYEEVAQEQGFAEHAHLSADKKRKHMSCLEHQIEEAERQLEDTTQQCKVANAQLEETLKLRIEAARIKHRPFGDKDVKVYHKDSLVQAWSIAEQATKNMEDARWYALTAGNSERKTAEREKMLDEREARLNAMYERQEAIMQDIDKALKETALELLDGKELTKREADMWSFIRRYGLEREWEKERAEYISSQLNLSSVRHYERDFDIRDDDGR